MRALKPLLLVAGLVVVGVLVYRVGAGPVVETLARLTWWEFVLISLPYAVISAVDTLGWRFAFAEDRAPFHRLFCARLAGEALNLVTALGSVGGEAAKAWLVRRNVTYEESVPAVIIAKTTITVAQLLFLLVGIVVAVVALDTGRDVLTGMLILLAVEALAVGGFIGTQLAGMFARGGRVLRWAGVAAGAAYAEKLDRSLREYYRTQRRRLTLSIGFHLAGWLLLGLETLLILVILDVAATPVTATVIEALGSGVRFATFFVPASLGPLEAANAAAFETMQLGAGVGLAFTLVRRARQAVWIVIGILVLIALRWRDRRAS